MTRDAVSELKEQDQVIMSVINALGGNAGKYKRERKAAIRAVVSEIYSPPRVTAAAKLLPELKIIAGFALDLTVADSDGRLWDFDDVVMRPCAQAASRRETNAFVWIPNVHCILDVAKNQQQDSRSSDCQGGTQESETTP